MTKAMKSALDELIALCGPWVDGGVSAPSMLFEDVAHRARVNAGARGNAYQEWRSHIDHCERIRSLGGTI